MANTADTGDRAHPISLVVSRIDDKLKTVRDAPAWSMSAAETREALVELTRLEAQIAELQLRVAGHGQTVEVEAESGATSTANWWAHATRQTRAAAHRKTRLAAALGSEAFEPVRVALAEGRLLVDQAQVIVTAVQALPTDLDTRSGRTRRRGWSGTPSTTTPNSCGSSAEADPGGGRPRGRRGPRGPAPRTGGAGGGGGRIVPDARGRTREVPRPVHHLVPARGDAEEAAARDRGTQAPRPRRRPGTGTRTPSAHRLGEAFAEYLETYPTDRLPRSGGV